MNDKAFCRKRAREIKKHIDFADISRSVCDKLISNAVVNQSFCVMLYMSLKDEIDLSKLYEYLCNKRKICCFPVVNGDEMYAFTADGGFRKGCFGIYEPCGNVLDPKKIDLVITPGVMFDKNCNRLGRGKGYYDRFFTGLSAYKIGVCPDELIVDSLPCDEHDLPVNMVITEKRVITND